MKDINEQINQYYLNKWREKKSGTLLRMMENENIESKYLKQMWQKLNIRKEPWVAVIQMQDNAFITGPRKAKIYNDSQKGICPYCKVPATIPHILHTCIVNKKSQLEKHDYICTEIYNYILDMYNLKEEWYELNNPPNIIYNKESQILVYYNAIVLKQNYAREFANKPDICMIDKKNKILLIIDATIVKDDQGNTAYHQMITKYNDLMCKLKRQYQSKTYDIIPVVISSNGLIHVKTTELLKIQNQNQL